MTGLEMLWEYQKADMAYDRFENKLKKSAVRQELIKVRNGLLEEQNKVKQLDVDLRKGYEECKRIADEYKRAEKEAQRLAEKFQALETEDAAEVHKLYQALDGINRNMNNLRKELTRISTLAEGTEKMVREVSARMVQGKATFDALKTQHDQELKEATPEMERLRAEVQKAEANVDPALLERYKKIKKIRMNPVAKAKNNQCGGCNMALPSVLSRRLKEGNEVVECENCGRILLPEE